MSPRVCASVSASISSFASFSSSDERDGTAASSVASFSSVCSKPDALKIKNTFIHFDKASVDTDSALTLPLRSVSVPSFSHSRSPSCRTPAPINPLEATPSRRGDLSKKSVTFNFEPSFFGDDTPNDEIDQHIENGGVSRDSMAQKAHPYLAFQSGDSVLYPMSVKNTFVHLDRSLCEDADCDLPTRSVSAPAMPTFLFPGTECFETCDTPMADREYSPNFQLEPLDGDSDIMVVTPVHAPLPADFSFPQTPDLPSQASGSRSCSSSALGSCQSSCNFRIKNTFVHVDVKMNVEDEEDIDFDLPVKSVSQPVLMFEHDFAPPIKSVSLSSAKSVSPPADSTLPSVGAALHSSGQCKPCAWFWKPGSCSNGAACIHCHLCPEAEIRTRKKIKENAMRLGALDKDGLENRNPRTVRIAPMLPDVKET